MIKKIQGKTKKIQGKAGERRLVDDLDNKLDAVGFPVRMQSGEGVDDRFHLLGEGCGVLFGFVLFSLFLPPADSVCVLVASVVGHVDDVGSLKLEMVVIDGELTAVETFGGKDGDGFGFSSVGDFEDTSLDGFFLEAQGAQF